ncbi:hypothetical protein [Yersinia phage fHe-Yen9-04]|uniref:Uncharacterized protein n=2 Tax=Eneladusvirus Yen904 TaxID=2560849 RepID=A0A2C9CXN5_9CAUD|nr:hypothetical protein FDJ41_gp501 [Yersinia phage fHe-Yen9-04]SOK58679.1 hypothetical protein [Yersinia phage fHe-Yen9-04]SOK59213.1 hypothetical protein [Yersinia phage fHe-Yen9-03]VUE36448.1 hypothetical protein [Yersinia phage fHe-Yen9-04]
MNNNLKELLDAALKDIKNMSTDDFFEKMYGYNPEQLKAYTEEVFLVELQYLRSFFVDGAYSFEPSYDNLPVPEITKLFWNYIERNARSTYEDSTEPFPTYYVELPKYGIRLTHIHGQGVITVVEDFDYSDPMYIVKNITRFKREAAWEHQRKIDELLYDKPKQLDEVRFSTEINGIGIVDTGIVERVYTKKGIVRYLIDSVHNGKVLVFHSGGNKYPMDAVEVTVLHPNNYNR